MMLTHCGNNVRNRYSGCVFSVKDIAPVPLKTSRNPRDALKSAYSLSRHDEAFNEDARVQLNNLLTRQALVGLAMRRDRLQRQFAPDSEGSVTPLRGGAGPLSFTPQQAQAVMGGIPAEEGAGLTRLAQRIVRQHTSVIDSPDAIRASLPLRGREYTFTRPLQVELWQNLGLVLGAREEFHWTGRWQLSLMAAVLFFALAAIGSVCSMSRPRPSDAVHQP